MVENVVLLSHPGAMFSINVEQIHPYPSFIKCKDDRPLLVAMLRGDPTLIVNSCSVRAKRGGDLTGP